MTTVAAISAFLAVPAVVAAMVLWALFLHTREERWGVANDIAVVIALLCLILPVFMVGREIGDGSDWISIVTWTALAGLVIAAAGQVLLISGLISLGLSFLTGGVGITPVLLWMVSIGLVSFGQEPPPAALGWATVAFLLLVLPVFAFANSRPVLAIGSQAVMTIGLIVWIIILGSYLVVG